MKRLRAVAGLATLLAACSGEHIGPGEVTPVPIPPDIVSDHAQRQARAREAIAEHGSAPEATQILFGDLHVHTTFSPDAFLTSLPMMGGSGIHPPADACDFARFCADLDFWSVNDHAEGVTPEHWRETIDSIRQCNAVSGDPANPDLVSFLGWEWTQVGDTPSDHYGHKNVVLRDTADDRVPARPIAAPRPEFRVALLPPVARFLFPLLHFDRRQIYFDYDTYGDEVLAVPECPKGVPTTELPLECHEVAATPTELFEKLDRWGFEHIVIPHGTSWGLMTPDGFSLARPLEEGQHDSAQERLFEIYSGHGSAEPYRDWPSPENGMCPAPRAGFLPCCWRAGEIIRERCEAEGLDDCEERVVEARANYLAAGSAGPRTLPGVKVADWLNCDQCDDCFNLAFSHRPGGSAQAALAMTREGPDGTPRRYRFGMIGSSDTHDARGGNGFKEFARVENTEAPTRPAFMNRFLSDTRKPAPRSEPVVLSEVPLAQRRYVERGASFFLTGGLVAAHAAGRDRQSIWRALESRNVYATSGDRILLWFDLLNGPDGPRPMGAEVVGQSAPPRFRVAAAGAFEQEPGCPEHVHEALTPERLDEICLGECYFPGEQRRAITRIEVVRIRAQVSEDEPLVSLIEDPWRVFPCPADGGGCRVEFEDPEFAGEGREVIYYTRAIQQPTLAVNAGGLRCRFDAEGSCIAVEPCYGDDRTPQSDDCLAPNQEHAWSSPIFIRPANS
ncbi:MAG: DUF3604 domain-containing protein [Deltaproteobacteria bacterium]|nr:DUF3604 domain-containing protein [Deltaproteobacteria bacterium]